ncbi:aminotransferase class I/II-fold pyridoxal phosphate-dependent enzyme [Pseudoflavonifractor sp. 524-17]|nr:aminotransferase class I/II-fold pyridoxal phosphate-dependent enzyme [Pseudoflavonifractor sp. 524-17]
MSEEAAFCGTKYAVACSNSTVALHLALKALGNGPGDEVIMPALTYIATANAVTYCGATPVFADSEWDTWNVDCADIEKKINKHTWQQNYHLRRGRDADHQSGGAVHQDEAAAFSGCGSAQALLAHYSGL